MSASDRPSGRANEYLTKSLVNGRHSGNSGGDGRAQLASLYMARVGSRGLTELRGSLSERDWLVLQALDGLHFLTARQLERLQYHGTGLTQLSATRSCRRDLARLHEKQLIDRLERRIGGLRAGSASFVYSLSSSGARLLGHSTRRRSREPSLAHLDHVLAIAELVVQLHELARLSNVELLSIETEPDCWRQLVGPQGARLTLKPDLRVTLGTSDHELHWFVEIDRGTEHRPVLARKCAAYLSAWRDGREQAQYGIFPRVLWVVPDDARAHVLRSVSEVLPGAPNGMFLTTTTSSAISVLINERGG